MRHLCILEPGRLDWQEAPDPQVAEDGVLVRPTAVARCDLDVAMAWGVFGTGYAVGHEMAGVVDRVGRHVTRWKVGDQVVVPFQVSCGTCGPCSEQRFAACDTYAGSAKAGAAFGFGPAGGGFGGGMADLLAVPHADHLLHRLPDGMPPTTACTVPDNLLDAWRCIGPHLERTPGADVLVVGGLAASIGLYAVAFAQALGAGEIRYADSDPLRCAMASDLGAVIEHVQTFPRRFDRAAIVVDNTGTEEGFHCAIRSTSPYGYLTGVGIQFTPTTPVPLLEMYTRGITLEVSRADSRRHLGQVLALVASGVVDPTPVTTVTASVDEAAAQWVTPGVKLVVQVD